MDLEKLSRSWLYVCVALLVLVLAARIARGQDRPLPVDPPECYWTVCRVTDGKHWCSATVVAFRDDGTAVLTTAAHCFGAANRDGIKVTYHRFQAGSDPQNRPRKRQGNQGRFGPSTAVGRGKYYPSDRRGDFATIIANLDGVRGAAVVGLGDVRQLGGRKSLAVGCPGGSWPPVLIAGTITKGGTDSRGEVIYSSQKIIGGQSGGALFDADTEWLIGVTNWGPFDGSNTQALAASSFAPDLRKWLPK